jgi:uncharacterized protein YeaO (DUF488 family)
MTGASNRLTGLTKELRAEWEHTKSYWNDAKSAEFEKRFLDELLAGANQAVNHIETLERILKRIRDDCA